MTEVKCFWIERVAEGGFRRTDTGEVRDGMGSWGPGALFAEPENPEHVHVLTPGRCWANLFSWTRTGDPRQPETFTARPSIQTHAGSHSDRQSWHGFLTNGVLKETP